jgi:hypothetical protein
MTSTKQQALRITSDSGHVTDFTARANLLAVQMNFHSGIAGEHVPVRRVQVTHVAAEDIDHHRGWFARVR